MSTIDAADRDRIRLSGLRLTKTRLAIFEILDNSVQPLSAEQIFLDLKERNVRVNLSTVYRTLDAFVDKNLAAKVHVTGENRVLYELNRMVHRHYLVCLSCKKIIPINNCPLREYEKLLEKQTHYLISGHKLDIYGYCPECRDKANL